MTYRRYFFIFPCIKGRYGFSRHDAADRLSEEIGDGDGSDFFRIFKPVHQWGWYYLLTAILSGFARFFSQSLRLARPCVTAAKILLAPFSWQTFAADIKVPAVEHISSARRTSFPLTSPIKVTTSTFVASDRCLSTMAKSTLRWLA